MNKRKIAIDIRRVPMPKTLAYLQLLIATKRVNIEREKASLDELEKMERELRSVCRQVKNKTRRNKHG